MKILHGTGFTPRELEEARSIILQNLGHLIVNIFTNCQLACKHFTEGIDGVLQTFDILNLMI